MRAGLRGEWTPHPAVDLSGFLNDSSLPDVDALRSVGGAAAARTPAWMFVATGGAAQQP
jgi:hypothetical protein